MMSAEEKARQKIYALRIFYRNILVYALVCLVSMIAWLTMRGPFWPAWVMIGCGLATYLQAMDIGKLPYLTDYFPFLTKEWEEEQLQAMLKSEQLASHPKKTKSKKSVL